MFYPTGSPAPTIHWSKLRSPLPWQHRLEGNTLIIPRVAQQDSGQYICNASSPIGHAEATVILHVESTAPVLSLGFPLCCMAVCVPPPGSSPAEPQKPHPEDLRTYACCHPRPLLGPLCSSSPVLWASLVLCPVTWTKYLLLS